MQGKRVSKSMEEYPGRKISPNMSRDYKVNKACQYNYTVHLAAGWVRQVLSD